MMKIFAIAMFFALSTTAMAEGLYAAIDLGQVSYSNATSTVSNTAPPSPVLSASAAATSSIPT